MRMPDESRRGSGHVTSQSGSFPGFRIFTRAFPPLHVSRPAPVSVPDVRSPSNRPLAAVDFRRRLRSGREEYPPFPQVPSRPASVHSPPFRSMTGLHPARVLRQADYPQLAGFPDYGTTCTGVPSLVMSKSFSAMGSGRRIQPCEAGSPGFGICPACMPMGPVIRIQ